jgi:hypothetical protein
MNFEFEHSMSPSIPFQKRVIKFWMILLWFLILITLISGFGMKLSLNHLKSSLNLDNQQPQEYEILINHRNQLQEELLSYELQPEPEVIFILSEFLLNLALLLPEGAHLVELRCEENSKLLLTGQVSDLVSFQPLTEKNANAFWSYESSNLTRIESTRYQFQLAYRLITVDIEP